MKWTDEEVTRAIQIVSQSSSMDEATRRIAKEMNRKTDGESLRKVFNRRGLAKSPFQMLRCDPIKVAERREEEAQLKREHRELTERLREAEARQRVLDRLGKPAPTVNVMRSERSSVKREGCAVVLASDWHVEEYVPRRADTAGNFYDLSVADKRVARFFSGVRWLVDFHRPVFGLRDMVLWLGGDLMTGYLRNENREENQLSPVETLRWLQTRVSSGITSLLQDNQLTRLVVVCSHGNHGRTTEKRQILTGAKNSYEWLLYQWLAANFEKEKRVTFVTDQSNHQYVKVYDFDLHFTHGDEVKYYGGIGGIAVPLMKAVAGWNAIRPAHYHHMGHWHQFVDYGDVTVNGSLIGYNAYAMSVRAKPEPPQQAFYVLDSKRGKSCRAPIWVTE